MPDLSRRGFLGAATAITGAARDRGVRSGRRGCVSSQAEAARRHPRLADYPAGFPGQYTVDPGHQHSHGHPHARPTVAARSDGWYDLTVTLAGDPTCSRRRIGHLEDGSDSVTG